MKALADSIAQLIVRVNIYAGPCDRDEEMARQDCITVLTSDLLKVGAHRLVINSRYALSVTVGRVLS